MTIFVFDEYGPEATAMLQALYSRSSKSVIDHIEKVKETGSANFMKSYYVGYGHSSIGDCGTTTVFIEDVSILATKVIQDNPLYSGQESSTRYIDFSKQRIVNPSNRSLGEDIQRRWIEFYLTKQKLLTTFLQEEFPLQNGQNETIWKKAIRARSFDILRSFLPAGICTQLSWTTNLRQAADQIIRLNTHPLAEVRSIAAEIHEVLSSKYPSSFSHRVDKKRNLYLEEFYGKNAFLKPKSISTELTAKSLLRNEIPAETIPIICKRPPKTVLPRNIANVGRYGIQCLLDYGSFRDLQRHRNAYCPMPLLTMELGFNKWYLDQLPEEIRVEADKLISSQEKKIGLLRNDGVPNSDLQYYIPMGYNVYIELEYDLSQILYVAELRSSRTVHPTLRRLALQMTAFIESQIPGLPVYADRSTDDFDIRRGVQDIVQKAT